MPTSSGDTHRARSAATEGGQGFRDAVEQALVEALVAAAANPRDGYLLWYLGLEQPAHAAFVAGFATGRWACALPAYLLDAGPDADRVAWATQALRKMPAHWARPLAQVVCHDQALRRGRFDLARTVAAECLVELGHAGPWPLPDPAEVAYATQLPALVPSFDDAVQRGLWDQAVALLVFGATVSADTVPSWPSTRAPSEPPLFPFLWMVDRAPLDGLSPSLLRTRAAILGDPGEAAALRTLAVDVLEAISPSHAAALASELAEAGADQLAAYLRLRAQRGAARSGELGDAVRHVDARAGYCLSTELADALGLLRAVYAVWSRTRHGNLSAAMRVLERCERDATPVIASAARGLADSLIWLEQGRDGLIEHLHRHEARDDDEPRLLERIYLQGEPMLMPLEHLLTHTARRCPQQFAAAFELSVRRFPPDLLLSAARAAAKAEAEHTADVLESLCRVLVAQPDTLAAWAEALPHLTELRALTARPGRSAAGERAARLERLTRGAEPRLAGLTHLLRATDAVDAGQLGDARQILAEAAVVLGDDPLVERLARRIAGVSGDSGTLEHLAELVEERRFLAQLEEDPESAGAYTLAHEHAGQGRWVEAAECLASAARRAHQPALRAALGRKAATWYADETGDLALALRTLDATVPPTVNREHEDGREAAQPGRTAASKVRLQLLVRLGRYADAHGVLAAAEADALDVLVDAPCVDWLDRTWTAREDDAPAQAAALRDLLSLMLAVTTPSHLHDALRRLYVEALAVAEGPMAAASWVSNATELGTDEHGDQRRALASHLRDWLAGREVQQRVQVDVALVDALLGHAPLAPEVCTLLQERTLAATLAKRLLALADAARSVDPTRAGLTRLAAVRVFGAYVGDLEQARAALAAVARRQLPSDALADAEQLATDLAAWGTLVELLQERARRAESSAERAAAEEAMGAICDEHLHSPGRAVSHYVAAFLQDPSQPAGLSRLDTRLAELGRYETLRQAYAAAIEYQEQHDTVAYDLETLYANKADLEFYQLDAQEDAAESLLRALRQNPREERYRALLAVVAEQVARPALVDDAIDTQLAALPAGDPVRLTVLLEAAERALSHPADVTRLGLWLQEIGVQAADYPRHSRRAMDVLQKHASWRPLTDLLLATARETRAADSACELLELAAHLAEHELGDIALAVEAQRRILERRPDDPSATETLTRLLRVDGNWVELAALHAQQAELANDAGNRAAALTALAELRERHLGLQDEAIGIYEEALRWRVRHDTVEGLVRALRDKDPTRLTGLLARAELTTTSRALRQEIRTHLAELAEQTRVPATQEAPRSQDAPAPAGTGPEPEGEAPINDAPDPRSADGPPEGEPTEHAARRGDNGQDMERQHEANGCFDEGNAALQSGDVAMAIEAFQRALTARPDHRPALTAMLRLAGSRDDRDLAAFLGQLGKALMAAIDAGAESEDATSNLVDVQRHLASLAVRRGLPEEALAALEAASVRAPSADGLWSDEVELLCHLRRLPEAQARCRAAAAAAQPGSSSWRAALCRAATLEMDHLGTPDQAVRTLSEVTQRAPSDFGVQFLLAQARAQAGDPQGARDDMARVVSAWIGAAPEQMPARSRHEAADHHYYLGRLEEATCEEGVGDALYERAVQFEPGHALAWVALLRSHWKSGRWEAFDQVATRAHSALARLPEALVRVQMLEAAALGEREPERADVALRAALDAAPDQHERLLSLALSRQDAGDIAGAAHVVGQLLRQAPTAAALLQGARRVYEAAGHTHAAQRIGEVESLVKGDAVPKEAEETREERVQSWVIGALATAPLAAKLRAQRAHMMPAVVSAIRERGVRGQGRLEEELAAPLRATLDEVCGRFGVKAELSIQVAGPSGPAVQVVPMDGTARIEVFVDVPDDEVSEEAAAVAAILVGRGALRAALGLEAVAVLTADELARALHEAGQGGPELESAIAALVAALSAAEDRAALWQGGLRRALCQVIAGELGIEVRPNDNESLRQWLAESPRAQQLLVSYMTP